VTWLLPGGQAGVACRQVCPARPAPAPVNCGMTDKIPPARADISACSTPSSRAPARSANPLSVANDRMQSRTQSQLLAHRVISR
jgi:hypothetical protein